MFHRFLSLQPYGVAEAKGSHISLYIVVSDVPPNTKLFVNFILRLKDQDQWNRKDVFHQCKVKHYRLGFHDKIILSSHTKKLS